MVRRHKVEEAEPCTDLCFTYPGSERNFSSYSNCKREAFETFGIEIVKYMDAGYSGHRHPILDCLDYADDSYREFRNKKGGL